MGPAADQSVAPAAPSDAADASAPDGPGVVPAKAPNAAPDPAPSVPVDSAPARPAAAAAGGQGPAVAPAAATPAPAVAAPAPRRPAVPPTDPDAPRLLLLGLKMGRLEVGTILVFERDGLYWVGLDDLDAYASVRIERDGGAVRARTPIGSIDLGPNEIVMLEGREHLAPQTLTERLHVAVRFNPQEFTLELRPPWLGEPPLDGDGKDGPASRPARVAEPPAPEVPAPRHGLSRIGSDTWYYSDESGGRVLNQTLAEGRLAGGRWRVRYYDDFLNSRQLDEYAWLGVYGQRLVLLGRQWTSLHPLLGSYELTGAQYAWTNQALSLFEQSPESRALIPRGLQPFRSFSGEGPPGGVAELWVDDRPVATRTIRLDGSYDFLDVPVPTRSGARVEVRVYDRFDRSIPVAIHEQTISASEYLLAKGAVVHQAGIGVAGNFVDDRFLAANDIDDTASGTDPSGFHQWRWGLSERLTLETAIQVSPQRTQILGGLVAQLTDTTTLAAALAESDGHLGYQVGLGFRREPWRLLLDSYHREAGFFASDAEDTFDHRIELGRRIGPNLDLSLIGGYRQSSASEAQFLLPALWWRPLESLFLRARPDLDGNYLADADLRLGYNARLAARYDGDLYTEAAYRFNPRLEAVASADFRATDGDLYGVQLRWQGEGRRRPALRAGLLVGDDGLGYVAGASLEVVPGVFASVEASSEPLNTWYDDDTDLRLRALVSVDFGFAKGRPIPTRSLGFIGSTGGIGGRVQVADSSLRTDHDLADLRIAVPSGPSARTGPGGEFFIGGVAPGVHRVTLEPDGLPIELVPERLSVLVEVAAGALTRVDFVVRPEYGIAGRVRDAVGRDLAGRRLEIVDSAGDRRGQAMSDRFGLYRIDGLPPGDYELRLLAEPGEDLPMPRRRVRIADDFLFGQDIDLR